MNERREDERLKAIADAVQALDPGSRTTVHDLTIRALADTDSDNLDDIVFDLGVRALSEDLRRACEERGVLLDALYAAGLDAESPTGLVFFVRRIANCDREPVGIDDVEGISFSSGGFFQGWSEVVILREEEGFELRLARSGLADRADRAPSMLSAAAVETMANALRECRVHEWRQDYLDCSVLDGEQWELQVNLAGGEAIVCHGSNAYPPRFRAFQEAMLRISANEDGEASHGRI